MKSFLFFTSFIIVFLLFGCDKCKKSDPIVVVVCNDGFQLVGDTCGCPTDKMLILDSCRALKPNEYFSTLGGCPCPDDTLYFNIRSIDTVAKIAHCGITDYNRVLHYPGNPPSYLEVNYIKLPDGDSLHYTSNSSFITDCEIGGQYFYTTLVFTGKVLTNNRLRLHLSYRPTQMANKEVGKCTVIFHK
jgi:hypothetical protein